MTDTYRVVRKFMNEKLSDKLLFTGLTLEEAQTHCNDPESSSKTCTGTIGCQRTRDNGPWFDVYYED